MIQAAIVDKRSGEMLGKIEEIYCVLCQDKIHISELKEWSGDGMRHFLCPGCDSDLLPPQPSLDKELDQEREAHQ